MRHFITALFATTIAISHAEQSGSASELFFDEDTRPVKIKQPCGGSQRRLYIDGQTSQPTLYYLEPAHIDSEVRQYVVQWRDLCVYSEIAKHDPSDDRLPQNIEAWPHGKITTYEGVVLSLIWENDLIKALKIHTPTAANWCEVAKQNGSTIGETIDQNDKPAPNLYWVQFEKYAHSLFELYVEDGGRCTKVTNRIYSTSCMGCVNPHGYRLSPTHWRFSPDYDHNCSQIYHGSINTYFDIHLKGPQATLTASKARHKSMKKVGRYGYTEWGAPGDWQGELYEFIDGEPVKLAYANNIYCGPHLQLKMDGDHLIAVQPQRHSPIPTGSITFSDVTECHPDVVADLPLTVTFRYKRKSGVGVWSIDKIEPYKGQDSLQQL